MNMYIHIYTHIPTHIYILYSYLYIHYTHIYIGIIDPRTGGLVKCFVGVKGVPNSAYLMVERCKCIYVGVLV